MFRSSRVSLVLLAMLIALPRAQAMDRDTRAVLVAGGYGILGGAAAGLVTLPLTQSIHSVFISTSLGLYLGLIAGIYYVAHRDNLAMSTQWRDPGPDPESVGPAPGNFSETASLQMQFPVLRF